MGEAKRRRLLDPNYGQSKIPRSSPKITRKILYKQTTNHFISENLRLTKYDLMPVPSDENNARHLINIIDADQNPNDQLAPNHWHEWVVNSAVDPTLTALNVRSLSGSEVYEYLLYALPQTARRNDGRSA